MTQLPHSRLPIFLSLVAILICQACAIKPVAWAPETSPEFTGHIGMLTLD